MERDDLVLRQRIEFRAGLAIAAALSLVALVPGAAWLGVETHTGRWSDALVGVPALLAALATLGLTGWWIDSIRTWWGPHRWHHSRSSTKNWLLPLVNLAAPPVEAGLLFESAEQPASWSRWWVGAWTLIVVGSIIRVDPLAWLQTLVAGELLAGLVLWLLISSMRSLRVEWVRRDAERMASPPPVFD